MINDRPPWQRIEPRNETAYGSLAHRFYGLGGKDWPRLTVGVWPFETGLRLTVYRKENRRDFWNEWPLPRDLAGEAAELLLEVNGG